MALIPVIKKRRETGLTLLEIVIAIVLVVAFIYYGKPWYDDYRIRFQVADVAFQLGDLRSTVGFCISDGRDLSSCYISLEKAGSELITGGNPQRWGTGATREYLESQGEVGFPMITMGGSRNEVAKIEAYFSDKAPEIVQGEMISWSRGQDNKWHCTTTVIEKYAPSGCYVVPKAVPK